VYGLTEKSEVSILTYQPAIELYTIFGHSAIRIKDQELGIDNIYNFGSFDFDESNFYFKLFRGELDFYLSITDYNKFKAKALNEKRTITEQKLAIDLNTRKKIFNELNNIYFSERKYYKYDFYHDNCATRIRDILEFANLDLVITNSAEHCCSSFRSLLKPYLENNYWIDFGINILLGTEADKVAESGDLMFLPKYLFQFVNKSEFFL
jgi:hypothetical protein